MTSLRILAPALAASVYLASLVAAQPVPEPRPYEGHVVVRAELRDLRDARTMNALSDDPWTCGWDGISPGLVDFRVGPEPLEALRTSGIPFEVLIPDVQKLLDLERAEWRAPLAEPPALRGPGVGGLGPAFFNDYQPLTSVSAGVDQLVETRPDLASRITLGRSLLMRDLFAIRITGPGGHPDRPAILINGCQHAREWITVAASMYLADALVSRYDTDPRIRRLVDAFEWHIVPVSNPDGYEFSWTPNNRLWRKNRRDNGNGIIGVDTNRNWSVGFGIAGSSGTPSNETYRGPAPFSEPESQALRNAMLAMPNLRFHVDVHSYGQLILEPIGYTAALPVDTAAFTALSAAMQSPMFGVAGMAYSPGPLNRNIYPVSGGMVDWVYDPSGADALSMSFELRDLGRFGFVLPASQIVPTSEECLLGLLAAAERLIDHPLDIEHLAGVPARVLADGSSQIEVRVLRGLSRPDPNLAPVLHQRIGRIGPFTSSLMTAGGSDEAGPLWRGTLNSGPCGSVIQYRFEVTAADGLTVMIPSDHRPFEAASHRFNDVLTETFEAPLVPNGWTAADPSDAATPASRWVVADPEGTVAQPEFDHTPREGSLCFHTGFNPRNNATNGDVDSGRTTLISPIINLAGYADAEISFWLWYSNNRGSTSSADDELVVDIASDGGEAAPTWVRALTLRAQGPIAQSTGVWRRHDLRVSSLVALTDQMRLRIIASDTGVGSTVEAALDDVLVRGLICAPPPCPGDFDGSGAVSLNDLFEFLFAFFAGDADVNGSGATTVDDVFAFLVRWFSGC